MAVEWSHCKRTQFRAAHHHHCLTKYTQYQNQLKILQCPNKRGCIFLSDTTCSANQLTLYITSVFVELLEQTSVACCMHSICKSHVHFISRKYQHSYFVSV